MKCGATRRLDSTAAFIIRSIKYQVGPTSRYVLYFCFCAFAPLILFLGGGCVCIENSWTYLPGLQFILAGLVGKTAAFFGVPAMRLALDVIVYFGVIAVFVTKVMVLEEAGTITPWELLWLGYLLGAVWQQVGGCVCVDRLPQSSSAVFAPWFEPCR